MAVTVINLESMYELSKIQRMKIKAMSGLNEIQEMVGKEFRLCNMATLTCHMDEQVNKKTGQIEDAKDYERYICVNKAGDMYVTSSPTFKEDIRLYLEEMGSSDFDILIRVNEVKSANNSGSFFKAEILDICDNE